MDHPRVPDWLKSGLRAGQETAGVGRTLRRHGLHTVCHEAHCPNRAHCYSRGTATFLILGKSCTRACRYCAVDKELGGQFPYDTTEPVRVAAAVAEMGLRYVVLTSVTRDDLPDGGAWLFAETVRQIRQSAPGVSIEVLVPDFGGQTESLRLVAEAHVDVFNHNLETVQRLFPLVRPVASYHRSLQVLRDYGKLAPGTPLKSGLMLGMGEDRDDIRASMEDLKHSGVSLLTLGQYLAPSKQHWPVARYLPPEEFEELAQEARQMGFQQVASGPLVRSSFHADMLASGQISEK